MAVSKCLKRNAMISLKFLRNPINEFLTRYSKGKLIDCSKNPFYHRISGKIEVFTKLKWDFQGSIKKNQRNSLDNKEKILGRTQTFK